MIERGASLTLDIEKPTAGGRMLARHAGQIVLVSGTIPGERVTAVAERVGKGVVFADTVDVLQASPDRRDHSRDWRCGGNIYSHIAYARQCRLKAEIIRDAFARIGRLPLAPDLQVVPSPETGYRMRARLHVQDGRIGFFREGTHELCDAAATGQLLPSTLEWLAGLREVRGPAVASVEIAENVSADQRAAYVDLHEGADPEPYASLRQPASITDVIPLGSGSTLTLTRDVRAFFQGNRFLLEPLVSQVAAAAGSGPVVDLYAGVGLFGLSLAALGAESVTLVEGDPVSGADLARNAEPFAGRTVVRRQSVESFLSRPPGIIRRSRPAFIVDPPRTGLTRDALAGILSCEPPRLVYVSCDVATLARDARTIVNAGYEIAGITGFDLFPNTAHVESVALFTRSV